MIAVGEWEFGERPSFHGLLQVFGEAAEFEKLADGIGELGKGVLFAGTGDCAVSEIDFDMVVFASGFI